MATFKLVISDPTTGKSEQKEVTGDTAKVLLGKKIGDTVKGDAFDLAGKTLIVRGGSDDCGFPMRADLPGTMRKRILITKSVGFRGEMKGIRRRKTVIGNTIHGKIHQVNLAVKADKVKSEKKPDKKTAKKKEAKPKAEEPRAIPAEKPAGAPAPQAEEKPAPEKQ